VTLLRQIQVEIANGKTTPQGAKKPKSPYGVSTGNGAQLKTALKYDDFGARPEPEIEHVHNATYRAHLYALTYYALGRKKESDRIE
jgi:hypothetical protein